MLERLFPGLLFFKFLKSLCRGAESYRCEQAERGSEQTDEAALFRAEYALQREGPADPEEGGEAAARAGRLEAADGSAPTGAYRPP